MGTRILLVLSSLTLSCLAQRSPYAGRSSFGYPQTRLLGENTVSTTTERLPIEANSDRALVNQFKRLPLDKQPFWLINWQAIEDQRTNPQTFQPKSNTYIDVVSPPRQSFPNRQSVVLDNMFLEY